MVLCFIALIVFAILGIFSVGYRRLAAEAFDCVFRKITLRKCESGLDMRLKSQITGSILKRSPRAGIFVFRHFELLSWIFTILLVASTIYVAYGGYNYYVYGNCNGPNSGGFCIFDPSGANSKVSSVQAGTCSIVPEKQAVLALNGFNAGLFPTLNTGADNKLIFIGCFTCQYTREVYPTIRNLAERDDVEFTFAHLHLGNGNDFLTPLTNCIYEDYPDKFLSTLDLLFNSPVANLSSINSTLSIISSLNINQTSLVQCINNNSSALLASQQLEEIKKTNIYGTPLVFVNGEPIEGPKPARVYERLLGGPNLTYYLIGAAVLVILIALILNYFKHDKKD